MKEKEAGTPTLRRSARTGVIERGKPRSRKENGNLPRQRDRPVDQEGNMLLGVSPRARRNTWMKALTL